LAEVSRERLLAAQAAADTNVPAAAPPETTAAWFARGLQLQPVVDGDILPVAPADAIQAGASANIPLLVSTTAEEFDFLIRNEGETLDAAGLAHGLALFGMTDADAQAYRAHHAHLHPAAILGGALTETVFRVPARRLAEVRLRALAPTFVAEFRWRAAAGLGACHCLDVPFAFDLVDAPGVAALLGAAAPQGLANALHRAWVNFITTGDAGWPAYRTGQPTVMMFGDQPEALVANDPLRFERKLSWARSSRTI
jgi:para-nitrobenzyl esterase